MSEHVEWLRDMRLVFAASDTDADAKRVVALDAAIVALSRSEVPAGWVLMPREPTEEMRTAHSMYGDTSDWWNALLAAANGEGE